MHDAPNRTAMRGALLSWPRHPLGGLSNDDPSVYALVRRRSRFRGIPWPLLIPALVAIAAASASTALKLDLWLADTVYAWQGSQWAVRWTFANEQQLHVAGRNASAVAWLIVVALCAASMWIPRGRARLRPLACLAVSVLLSTALVAWVKSWSNVDCPWDLLRYGGERAYVSLFAIRPTGMPRGACFPAGHASGGYAWMAAYFFFLAVRPAWRWRGLAAGVLLGLVFGLSQQLRGAHFLSHDLWTAALCWLVAVAVHASAGQPLRLNQPLPQTSHGEPASVVAP